MVTSSLIAIDWGTSAARAYRMNARGNVEDQRASALGVAQVGEGSYPEALAELLGDWRGDPAPRIACGMVGSRQGWVEAPYVACPASLDTLAAALTQVDGTPLAIVPGLITRDRHGVPDVMRGEETQLVGAVAATEAPVLAVLPGTHSKWARVERGMVVDFATYMTGELYAVLLEHSIIGRMARKNADEAPGVAFARGVQRGLHTGGLTHDIFGARTLALTEEIAPDHVADWLSGLLIGREIHDAVAWARSARLDVTVVRIVGSATLVVRYAAALALAGIDAEPGVANAAALGLWRIAGQAGLLH